MIVNRHPARLRCRGISSTHLQFCCHRCSTLGPYSLGQAVQGSPRYGWRNPASVPLKALSPCQLDENDHEYSEVGISIPKSVINNKSNENRGGAISNSCFGASKQRLGYERSEEADILLFCP